MEAKEVCPQICLACQFLELTNHESRHFKFLLYYVEFYFNLLQIIPDNLKLIG